VSDAEVIYVFDAYCGWCYGFGPTLRRFSEATRDRAPVRVVSGGLFTGTRRQAIGRYGFMADANARITELTGVQFGGGYERARAEGTLVLDSEAAAAGYAALRAQDPGRGVELADAVQRAFFVDGSSLSDPDTFRTIAVAKGLSPALVPRALNTPAALAAARVDFAMAHRLGVDAFPALLVRRGDRLWRLPGVGTPPQVLTRRLADVLGETDPVAPS
jgi:putative protein-disulfide isomerase